MGDLVNASLGRARKMLLLVFASLGVLVVEDEVNFVGVAALVRAEHNDVRRSVAELLLVKRLVVTQELHISATTFETL